LQIAVIGRWVNADLGGGLVVSDPEIPLRTAANGTLMARGELHAAAYSRGGLRRD